MSYTRRQYVLMAVLAVGLGALMVDLLFLRGQDLPPQKAQAQPADQEKDLSAPAQANGTPSAEEPRYAMARKVRQYAAQRQAPDQATGDAFQPSDDWMAELRKKPVELDPVQAMAQGFMDRHRLSSAVCLPSQSTAIVDEQLMRAGDVLDGFRLESIKPTSVVFSRDGVNVVLNINQGAAGKEE